MNTGIEKKGIQVCEAYTRNTATARSLVITADDRSIEDRSRGSREHVIACRSIGPAMGSMVRSGRTGHFTEPVKASWIASVAGIGADEKAPRTLTIGSMARSVLTSASAERMEPIKPRMKKVLANMPRYQPPRRCPTTLQSYIAAPIRQCFPLKIFDEATIDLGEPDPKKHRSPQTLTAVRFAAIICGPDGTRTRDLRRDRAAF